MNLSQVPWKFRELSSSDWLPATVPGSVQTDLLALGRIPDPFVADNETAVQWVGERDWVYQCHFDWQEDLKPGQGLDLVCEGLDTLVELELNGLPVGQADNMFRVWRFSLGSAIRQGSNELMLIFRSPQAMVNKERLTRPFITESSPIRKAPCHFGWDWGPKLLVMGIWKALRLELVDSARIVNVSCTQDIQGPLARPHGVALKLELEAEQRGPEALEVLFEVTAPDGSTWKTRASLVEGRAKGLIYLENPALWWPHGYGEAPLYRLCTSILGAKSFPVATDCRNIGIRSLELRQESDQWGRSFTFVVNGVPIFAKGANWIPADSFPHTMSPARYQWLLESAARANHNMVRVWGGGYYENEEFYDLCDRLGLLVWQDMMFGCNIYPLDEQGYLAKLEIEIREQIRRLRHRPSLAIWCGDNEQEMGWEWWGWDISERKSLKKAYHNFIYDHLRRWIRSEDPGRAYWPSSPSSQTPGKNANGDAQGDMHFWDVWHHRKPFTAYREQFPRFMSEFGFQSFPPMATIRAFAAEKDLNISSRIMDHHQKSPIGNGIILSQMLDTFRMPRDFEALVYSSMVLQAEGIRYGVEHWRRNRARVSGTIYWQLNDCWPVTSWSSIDYYGRWKALHYASKRFFNPVLLSAEDSGTTIAVHVSNDLPEVFRGSIHWAVQGLDGTVVEEGDWTVDVPGLDSVKINSRDYAAVLGEKGKYISFLHLSMEGLGSEYGELVVPFVPSKHLELEVPLITMVPSVQGRKLLLAFSTNTLARFVELTVPGMDLVFSDNYFDLVPGTPRVVELELKDGDNPAVIGAAMRWTSLVQAW